MRLTLLRPLSFFDLETTGKDVKTAEIVEICIVKLHPDQTRTVYETYVKPRNPIPAEATAIHGITDEMVIDAPYIEEIIDEIYAFFEGSDIGGYNSNGYDIPLLSRIMFALSFEWPANDQRPVDACVIFKRKEGRTLKDATLYYTGEVLEDAHKASVDVNATIDVFLAQLDRYDDLPTDVNALAVYSNYDAKPAIDPDGKFDYDEEGHPYFKFGKHVGKRCKLDDETKSYLTWIVEGQNTFSPVMKSVAQKIKDGVFDPKELTEIATSNS